MKTAPLLAAAFAALTFTARAGDDEEHVPTQAEMNQQAADDFKKADTEMNAVYKKLQTAQDDDGKAKLKAAQKAWLAYRDAEAAFEAGPNKGGTVYPMVYAATQQRITEARTGELSLVLESGEEQTPDDGGRADSGTGAKGNDPNQ